jgi:hypothetical protein
MQGMLDNLSQPVAFATAPLGSSEAATPAVNSATPSSALRRDGSLSSDTDIEEPMVKRFTRRIGMSRGGKKGDRSVGSSSGLDASTSKPHMHEEEFDEDIFDEGESCSYSCHYSISFLSLTADLPGDDLSESFCLIPSGEEPSPLTLKRENASLKAEVETMQKRLQVTERVLQLRKEQDQQLRDSIFLATREVRITVLFCIVICSYFTVRPSVQWVHLL